MITWRARAYKPRESTPQPHTGHHWASREHAGALGGYLLTALVVSGMKVARARFRRQCGTRERLAPMPLAGCWTGWRKGEAQAAETVRARVPMRGRRADRLVVVRTPGNAGRAKGTGRPGSFDDQPAMAGGAG